MNSKSGRRQFLKSVAATAALSSSACGEQRGEKGVDTMTSHTTGPDSNGSSPVTTTSGETSTTVDELTSAQPSASSNENPSIVTRAQSSSQTSASPEVTSTDVQTSGSPATDTTSAANESHPLPSSPLGVALLGLGKYASERLAPALELTQHCKLVGIVTGTPSKVDDWQARYAIEDKNVYSYDTMDALIDNPDIHVIYVVTPNHVHPEFVARAARAKKHVWCEKPLAMTSEECQAMIDVCKENGVTLAVGYRLQHEPNTQTFGSYAATKPFGAITQVEALAGFNGFSSADSEVWRLKKAPGGGALFDMGVYCINAARYALKEEPIRVRSATQWTNRPELFAEVDEFTDFELEFPSGALAVCRTSFGERMDFVEVTCEQGSYKLEPFQAYTGVNGSASDGTQFNQSIQNQQAKQMDDDALAIIEGRPLLVPGEEGLRDVIVVEAIFQSVMTQMPVDIG